MVCSYGSIMYLLHVCSVSMVCIIDYGYHQVTVFLTTFRRMKRSFMLHISYMDLILCNKLLTL